MPDDRTRADPAAPEFGDWIETPADRATAEAAAWLLEVARLKVSLAVAELAGSNARAAALRRRIVLALRRMLAADLRARAS